MRPVFRGCLYSNYTKWFTSGFQIRQGMQQNIIPVPTSKLPFKVQFFAETYFRVFKPFAKIAKIRSSRKFLLIRYITSSFVKEMQILSDSLLQYRYNDNHNHLIHCIAVCWIFQSYLPYYMSLHCFGKVLNTIQQPSRWPSGVFVP